MEKKLGAVDTVLFDFDGTLGILNIDFAAIRTQITHLARHYGIDPDPFTGYYVLEMIQALRRELESRGTEGADRFCREAMEIVSRAEVAAALRGELIPGTEGMLKLLKQEGFKLGVVTRNCYAAVSLVLPGLESYFGAGVVTRERTARFKPDPEHLHVALELLESGPKRALMVGDHPMDMMSGRAAGAFTVGVLTGQGSRESLTEAGCDYLLTRADGLPALLGLGEGGK